MTNDTPAVRSSVFLPPSMRPRDIDRYIDYFGGTLDLLCPDVEPPERPEGPPALALGGVEDRKHRS